MKLSQKVQTIICQCRYYSIDDGKTWTNASVAVSGYGNIYDIAYGNGRFVCVGDNGASYYSTDGALWTPMTGLDSSANIHSVTYVDNI